MAWLAELAKSRAGLAGFENKLRFELEKGKGVRVGETTVVSRKVHTMDQGMPEVVRVVRSQDAGVVFYGRPREGEVIHMDIFHALATVDHVQVAAAVRRAVGEYRSSLALSCSPKGSKADLADRAACLDDYIDVQTASGGGRVTGSLHYGQKFSLRMAHRSHVHLALMIPDDFLGLIYYIVQEVEAEIVRQGVELRKVQKVVPIPGSGGVPYDLSPYQSNTDSLIRGSGAKGDVGPGRGVPCDEELERAVGVASHFGSVAEAEKFLDMLSKDSRLLSPRAYLEREYGDSEAMIAALRAMDVITSGMGPLRLTAWGLRLLEILRRFSHDVERRLFRRIRKVSRTRRGGLAAQARTFSAGRKACVSKRLSRPLEPAEWPQEISVPDSISAAVTRLAAERAGHGILRVPARRNPNCADPGCATAQTRVTISREDIRVRVRTRAPRLDIVLLIDASASMSGRRIQAAKYMARHLFLTGRDRVSVLTFQENQVTRCVERASTAKALEMGLARINPAGLTPLAEGISEALELIERSGCRAPFLVLLTDGIPTMHKWTSDPSKDALTAAAGIARRKVPFCCIGLAPNRTYLEKVCAVAKGSLYVVDEFDRETLADVVRRERARTPAAVRPSR